MGVGGVLFFRGRSWWFWCSWAGLRPGWLQEIVRVTMRPPGVPLALAAQVAVGLQLAQGGGDTGRALGEAGGEGLDVDAGAGGERLDVDAQADRESREGGVLGEMVADHREAGGVAGVVVDQAARVGVVFARDTGLGARGRARVLGVHREGCFFLGGQALALGCQSRRGPSYVWGISAVVLRWA